jgi:hypothetical protein
MIRMLTAYTEELLDTEAACTSMLAQLNLARHVVRILFCMTEFVETGMVKALCNRLPFDVVGCTTMGTTVQGVISPLMLTLTVLTSEDVFLSRELPVSLMGSGVNRYPICQVQGRYIFKYPVQLVIGHWVRIYMQRRRN